MSQPTETQIRAGARAYDAAALSSRGWSDDEIKGAMRTAAPSKVGIATARIILEAALTAPIVCQDCGDTGWRDTGGVQPWGEAIIVVCDCEYARSQMGPSTDSTKERSD